MALHGHAKLILTNEKSGWIEKVVEQDNTITNYVDYLTNEGNFQYFIGGEYIMPVDEKFFGGCILTNKNNVNALSTMMIDGDAEVTAQASNDAYSGEENLRRGSFMPSESGPITSPATGEKTGFRKVWEWSSSQGNGLVGSVSLCKPELGRTHFSKTLIPSGSEQNATQMFYSSDASTNETIIRLSNCQIIDYEKGVAYYVDYDSGIITVNEYIISTKTSHLLSIRGGLIGDTVGSGDLKSVHTYTETISGFTIDRASVTYTGDEIHLITWTSGNNVTVTDRIIATDVWDSDLKDTVSHQYNGVSFYNIYSNYAVGIARDIIKIEGTYMYAYASISSVDKIFKFNLLGTNPATVQEIDFPSAFSSISRKDWLNGPTISLPNGDWYKIARINESSLPNYTSDYSPALYCHNGDFYATKTHFITSRYQSGKSIQANPYGTFIATGRNYNGQQGAFSLGTIFPYVSTIANIEIVEKKPSFSMKLIYEITETTGS